MFLSLKWITWRKGGATDSRAPRAPPLLKQYKRPKKKRKKGLSIFFSLKKKVHLESFRCLSNNPSLVQHFHGNGTQHHSCSVQYIGQRARVNLQQRLCMYKLIQNINLPLTSSVRNQVMSSATLLFSLPQAAVRHLQSRFKENLK